MVLVLHADDGFQFAGVRTNAAHDALHLINDVRLFPFAADCADGTFLAAGHAAFAFDRINARLGERPRRRLSAARY